MRIVTKRIIYISALIAVFAGLGMGIEAMREAWEYNLGGDIYSDETIHWDYWLIVGLFWFVPVTSLVFIFGLLFAFIFELWARAKERKSRT